MSQKNAPKTEEQRHTLKRPRSAGMLQPLALPATARSTQDRHTQGIMITIILEAA